MDRMLGGILVLLLSCRRLWLGTNARPSRLPLRSSIWRLPRNSTVRDMLFGRPRLTRTESRSLPEWTGSRCD